MEMPPLQFLIFFVFEWKSSIVLIFAFPIHY